MDDVVRQAIEAIEVLERLAAQPVAEPPAVYELRDGQIYRWTVSDR